MNTYQNVDDVMGRDNLIYHQVEVKNNPNFDDERASLPFDMIKMLNAVKKTVRDIDSIEWITTSSGKLTDISIYFVGEGE